MNQQIIEVFTDGSCNTNSNLGAWVAMLFVSNEKIVLKEVVWDTTHNRMELMAAIKAIEFVACHYKNAKLKIYTDSQYLSCLPQRRENLKRKLFNTNKGKPIQNADLVKTLIYQIENHSIEFSKVKAHQKSVIGYSNPPVDFNIEVDKLARKLVRETIKHSDSGKASG